MHILLEKHDIICAISSQCGVIAVKEFKIPSIPPTTNKTVRFPNDLIEGVENAIRGKDCTFSAFVIEAVRSALRCLEEENQTK